MRGADDALPRLPRARGDLDARARRVTETRSTGKMRVRDGMILSQRTDGLSVVGLTLLEVRA